MNKKKRVKRENFFLGSKAIIYPRLQLRVVLFNQLLLCFIFGSIAVFLNYKLQGLVENTEQLKTLKVDFILPTFLIFLAGSIISIILNTFISFKIAAPVLRLKNYFQAVGDTKEIQPLSFRKGDYFRDIPSLVVNALMRLSSKDESKEVKKKAS